MVLISEYIESARFVQKSIRITNVPEESPEAIAGPEIDLDSTLCISVLGLAQYDFLFGA